MGTEKHQRTDHDHELTWTRYRKFCHDHLATIPPLREASPTVNDMIAFFTFNFRKPPATIKLRKNGVLANIKCKGLQLVSLQKYRLGLEYTMQKAGHPNLFSGSSADPALVNCFESFVQKHKGKYAYTHKGAAYFELWSDFDRMRKHCYAKNSLLGLRNWTMVFLMFALLLRYFPLPSQIDVKISRC